MLHLDEKRYHQADDGLRVGEEPGPRAPTAHRAEANRPVSHAHIYLGRVTKVPVVGGRVVYPETAPTGWLMCV